MTVVKPDIRQWKEAPDKDASQDFSRLARELLRVRLSMLIVNELLKKQAFKIPIHLALGHEAIAVAVADAMQADDRLLLTHRNIHYNLARNPSLRLELDEYFLLESGLAGGREGAMNLTNPAAGVIYTSSILANCLPVATGVAMGQCLNESEAVTITITGDGALEEGAFYETAMIGNSLQLPLIMLVENNEWSMHTRIEERRCPVDLGGIAHAFGMNLHRLEGNDLAHYCETLRGLRREVAATRKPCILEVGLSTLGDFRVPDDASPEGRLVNYHHGAAPHVSLADGPLIEPSGRDPLHAISQRVPSAEFARWTEEILADLEASLP